MMQATETLLRPGDAVRECTGGPVMQVYSCEPWMVRCFWQTGRFLHYAYFHPSAIERTAPRSTPAEA
ncbi:MAG TPA: hypothetical protein VHB77_21910 [Planctomycetaceae bacterium]|nr:hypothetical protein [Planctomycetaceae bacterium]